MVCALRFSGIRKTLRVWYRQENSPRGRWYYIPYESYTVRSIQRRECQAPHGDSTFTRGYPPGTTKTLFSAPPGTGPKPGGAPRGPPPRASFLFTLGAAVHAIPSYKPVPDGLSMVGFRLESFLSRFKILVEDARRRPANPELSHRVVVKPLLPF